ncbi:MAG TPA: YajQ family cyclic di-GMP-binding protein [Blastocatellia bacterium]|nr:YajQ family cyclic di-GMP-binding protein [Blastocatellia bacterium]
MAQQNTFDVVSKVDMAEVKNAVNQASKEISQRFDFKGTNSEITLDEKEHKLVLATASEFTLKQLNDVLQQKLTRRGISLKALDYGKVEPAAKDSVRQTVTLQQGIPIEKAREIVKFIKDTKLKVQAAINGDFVRVSGKDRDSLQEVIAALKEKDFGIDMQYTNYRTN